MVMRDAARVFVRMGWPLAPLLALAGGDWYHARFDLQLRVSRD